MGGNSDIILKIVGQNSHPNFISLSQNPHPRNTILTDRVKIPHPNFRVIGQNPHINFDYLGQNPHPCPASPLGLDIDWCITSLSYS